MASMVRPGIVGKALVVLIATMCTASSD
jgi:hypothetical protein